jgi:RNA polymerase sigma factor (sigma-70 family)
MIWIRKPMISIETQPFHHGGAVSPQAGPIPVPSHFALQLRARPASQILTPGVNKSMDPLAASDGDLLASSRSNPDAFAAFYDRYETSVVGYFARRTGDPEVAADLAAEVFAAALAASHRYRPENATAAGWLFAIAHNKLMTSLRRGRVEADARRRLGIREPLELAAEELERVERCASADGWVIELLQRLPPLQRDAVRARILDERSYPDIAGELQTSELVVRQRVSRGLSKLRAELEEQP